MKDLGKYISSFLPDIKNIFGLCGNQLMLFSNFMVIVALLGAIPLFMQSYRVWKYKESQAISVPAFTFAIIISFLWLVYALIMKDGVLIVSSIINMIAACLLIFLTIYYRNGSNKVDGIKTESLLNLHLGD